MDDLHRVIAARKRQDLLFNLLGMACTVFGVLALTALLLDLFIDSLGLLGQYRKDLVDTKGAETRVEPRGKDSKGRPLYQLAMTLDDKAFVFPLDRDEAELIQQSPPRGTISLEGDRLFVPLGGLDRIVVPLSKEQVRFLTRDDSFWKKAAQVFPRFLTAYPGSEATQAGILSPLIGSFLVILVTFFTAVPLGVAAGIYLEEYASKNWLTTIIEINISNLAGVPSILYGLMALGLMVYYLHLGKSIITAGFTLAFLILPIVIVATREALRSIPQAIREAAYALGATRWQVVRYHLLPYSASGIATGVIIGLSRAIGETAPLITIGALTYIAFLPTPPVSLNPPAVQPLEWLWSPFSVLPIQMFNWVSRPEQEFRVNAAATGVSLIVFTLGLNAVAIYLRYRLRRRIKW